ncbi:MAG: COX15/CtaA family protein, partial [Verrucomicrobia bacterium]|nr:COX15/CtaA family protein [Verrucomicrobiota bacterium]
MSHTNHNPWLHRFALLTAFATLGLIGLGGLVTSHGAGMAVPDWPTSYGYNMFALPFKFWKGGAFFEHTHRLLASGVGLLTTVLAVWLWRKESRRWLRWLGVAAFVGVVLQGVLGGLRVVWFKDEIGIFHAALAQVFFVLVSAIALFTSEWWAERRTPVRRVGENLFLAEPEFGAPVRRLFLFTTVLIWLQLILGATMRHQHAGLAIPDFPLVHGKLWPDTSAAAVVGYNAARFDLAGENPITAFQIWLQLAHRFGASLILG